jgi:hypothetical protein
MSETFQKNKHIVVSEETYKQLLNGGRYSDTMDTIISQILMAHQQRKHGEHYAYEQWLSLKPLSPAALVVARP